MLSMIPTGARAILLVLLTCNILFTRCHNTFASAQNDAPSKINDPSHTGNENLEELGLHYGKYLKEVVAALEKDQKFSETIKNMEPDDIKSGKVADQLEHVHEDVRKRLNVLKDLEMRRLRDLATRKNELEQYGETYHGTDKRKWRTLGSSLGTLPDHLGSHQPYFDTQDLKKLLVAATNDLEKLDKERREDYKTYEMEKEWQFQERLKMLNETEKARAIKARKELKEKHDDHPKVHEPGTKSQFEEVWEKKDHLPANEFDPKTFFALHDLNSDNYWDPGEVRQLLVIEINKLYDPNNPEDDPNEMGEEHERMREHLYKVIDLDKDGLISLMEFLEYSKNPQFKQDKGWEDNSKHKAYSQKDYEDFEKHREQMLRNSHGHYYPAYYANQPQNMHLPNWGLGMPAGVNPAQYYGYQVDPNHPHAQQILAQQQQQQMAYQQAAYHQQTAGAGFQQPAQHYNPAQVAGQQPVYQQPQVQNNQYQQHQAAVPQQVSYHQQQAPPPINQQQNIPQNVPQQNQVVPQQQQQQQAIPQQQPVPQQPQQAMPQQQQQPSVQQATYQQVPQQQPQLQQPQPQQAIPQQQQNQPASPR